ncbi:uncharacterized protein MONOS_18383 [Monocercomonoides exilis]|uniref:uncharacterized protein n=1 Tax=Monocercomonoides exilis TaxID=2049356 RepID=UPI003559E3EB|nr:hypothetical protein MONOS_18383 [Monocercomonoides exilis]
MEMCDACKFSDDAQEPSLAEKYSKLLGQLEHSTESEQKQKIEEMNETVEKMNKKEFTSVFTEELFSKIRQMIEEKKLSIDNALVLLKHVGYFNMLNGMWNFYFDNSMLSIRLQKMIINENNKKEGKNEKLLIDLCECNFMLYNDNTSDELVSIIVLYLMKAALKKEENEEIKKEVEMALFALSKIGYHEINKELYLNEIKEIIKYHQEHHNLTRLTYQSAWKFLTIRFYCDKSLEAVILYELHFAREAIRELEELTKWVNWKKIEEEMSKEEANEVLVIRRWIGTLEIYFSCCLLRNEEYVGLFGSVVRVFRAAKENHKEIFEKCIDLLIEATEKRAVIIDGLLKSGAIDAVLEEIQWTILNDTMIFQSLRLFMKVSSRLKGMRCDEWEEEEEDEAEEAKRKALKRKVFEKMEEGYEDTITSYHEQIDFLNRKYYDGLSLDISDYFVNV